MSGVVAVCKFTLVGFYSPPSSVWRRSTPFSKYVPTWLDFWHSFTAFSARHFSLIPTTCFYLLNWSMNVQKYLFPRTLHGKVPKRSKLTISFRWSAASNGESNVPLFSLPIVQGWQFFSFPLSLGTLLVCSHSDLRFFTLAWARHLCYTLTLSWILVLCAFRDEYLLIP